MLRGLNDYGRFKLQKNKESFGSYHYDTINYDHNRPSHLTEIGTHLAVCILLDIL
jgi:hypothetical protein